MPHLHEHLRAVLRHLPAGDVDHDRHAHSLRGLPLVQESTLAFHRHAASAGPLSPFAEDSERTIRELMARHGYKVQ
jgi:hypothetical protein